MTDAARTRQSRRLGVGGVLLFLIDAPLVIVVIVGYLAAFLPPRPYWWAQLVAVGLPYATWALAGVGVLWAMQKQWGAVVVHVLLVGLVLWRADVVSGALEGEPDDVVLTTFNVPGVGPSREALGDSVVGYVRATDPDVVLMQDAWVYGSSERRRDLNQAIQVEAVTETLPYTLRLPERLAGHPGWRENTTGVPVLVRDGSGLEVVEQEALVLGTVRDPDVSLVLRSVIEWGGRQAVVYNVHLRSFGASKPWEDDRLALLSPSTWRPYLRRYRSVYAQRGDEVSEIAERIEGETLPVVVAGDFNSTADNWSYRRLRTAGGVDRTDAYRTAGDGWGRTYHSRRPFVRIDFALVDPALEVVVAETAPVTFSDHRPVRTVLRWRE